MVAGALGWEPLLALLVLSLVVICAALVVAHGLWERAPSPRVRERVILFNVSTVSTLALGVITLYAVLFVVYALAAAVFVPTSVIEGQLEHAIGFGDYLELA